MDKGIPDYKFIPPPPPRQMPRIIKEGQQPEPLDSLMVRVGPDTTCDPSEMYQLNTFSDMCRVVNLGNIDNFLQDFEQLLRTITVGTENVDKSEINFGPMLWKEDE